MPSQIKQLIAEGQKLIQTLQAENQKLKTDLGLAAKKLDIEQFSAETERLKALAEVGAKAGAAGIPARPNGAAPSP